MDMVAKVDKFPKDGETVVGLSLNEFPGGKGANQAIAAARQGANVEMIGMVGADTNGMKFLKIFEEEKIIARNVHIDTNNPTGLGLIQVNRLGENKIVVIKGANDSFGEKEYEQAKADILESEIVVLQLEMRQEINCNIIEICKENNIKLVLNPAPAIKLSEKILNGITYLTPNESELEILTGMVIRNLDDTKLAVKKLLDIGVENVIATLGCNGALIGNKDSFIHVNGYCVDVVDTVAAGDSFNGALAYKLMEGDTLEDSVRYANAVGALTVTCAGAIPSLPRKEIVDKFILRNNEKRSN